MTCLVSAPEGRHAADRQRPERRHAVRVGPGRAAAGRRRRPAPRGRQLHDHRARRHLRRLPTPGRSLRPVTEMRAHEAVNQYFADAAPRPRARRRACRPSSPRPYREIAVQVPVRLDDGSLLVTRGLPGPAQRRPGPVQGRHPLPPERRPQRGPGPRLAHDLEDGAARPALRRGQGRHRGRPDRHERRRAPAHDPPVHAGHPARPRRVPRHPGARREHQRQGDGVDDGRLLGQPRLQPRHRHRQAARPRRRARAARRPPGGAACSCSTAYCQHHGLDLAAPARRDPGLRQRRLVGGPLAARARREGRSPCPTCAAAVVDPAGIDVPGMVALVGVGRLGRRGRPAATSSPTRSCSALDCDVLVPAALGEVITGANADEVRARVVLEAANYPVTPDADKVLARPGHRRRSPTSSPTPAA